MGRHSAHRSPAPPADFASTLPLALPQRRRHAARPQPFWRRHPSIPAAALVLTVLAGADSLHLVGGISHADALNKGAADVKGVDLSALASGAQAGVLNSGSRVSRSSRTATGTEAADPNSYTMQARPGLPSLNPDKTVPGTWIRPSAGEESSCFCMRWGVMHEGIDLAGPMGSPILAVGDGVVVEAGPAAGFGLWVVIRHSNGDLSVYGHMYHYFVTVGEHVKAGQHIADIGANGQSTGPHLHFGVMKGKLNGTYVDPIPWLKARGIVIGPYNPDA
ncbi:MAG: M23 family metallopeptidase [Actinomycetota bacterium]|nr:M23 family metallopeptidase [Actinomycetota bacterium]MDQ2955782.1 M23 family metallopeptidase [Actinomycetota bacterium]